MDTAAVYQNKENVGTGVRVIDINWNDEDMTDPQAKDGPSLEQLLENGNLQVEILYPGGLEITKELANLCEIGQGIRVLDVASDSGESDCFLCHRQIVFS